MGWGSLQNFEQVSILALNGPGSERIRLEAGLKFYGDNIIAL